MGKSYYDLYKGVNNFCLITQIVVKMFEDIYPFRMKGTIIRCLIRIIVSLVPYLL